jgi:hypothetical protein
LIFLAYDCVTVINVLLEFSEKQPPINYGVKENVHHYSTIVTKNLTTQQICCTNHYLKDFSDRYNVHELNKWCMQRFLSNDSDTP